MEQDCLSHLALFGIEHAYSNMVDTENVIDESESRKGRSNLFF